MKSVLPTIAIASASVACAGIFGASVVSHGLAADSTVAAFSLLTVLGLLEIAILSYAGGIGAVRAGASRARLSRQPLAKLPIGPGATIAVSPRFRAALAHALHDRRSPGRRVRALGRPQRRRRHSAGRLLPACKAPPGRTGLEAVRR